MTAVWEFLSTYVFPLLGAIGEVIIAVVVNAFEMWSALITNVIIPALGDMWTWIDKNIMPTLRTFAGWVSEKVSPALSALGDVIKDIIQWFKDLAAGIRNLSLPDWLTPGSPTPFELGLLGIQDALQKVARQGLPMLETGLQLSPVAAGVTGIPSPQGAAAGGSDNNAVLLDLIRRQPDDIARAVRSVFEKTGRK